MAVDMNKLAIMITNMDYAKGTGLTQRRFIEIELTEVQSNIIADSLKPGEEVSEVVFKRISK